MFTEYWQHVVIMTLHILVSGPLRPSVDYVVRFGQQLRHKFASSRIHILYWKTTDVDAAQLATVYDTVIPYDEPSDALIYQAVPARTIQQRQIGPSVDHFTPNIFKMYYGVKFLLDALQLPSDTIVMRIRTDSYIIQIDDERIRQLISSVQPRTFYFCPRQTGLQSCDWFGISDVATLYKVYTHSSISDYNAAIRSVYNAEQVIPFNASRHGIQLVDIRSIIRLAIYRGSAHPRFPEIHEYH